MPPWQGGEQRGYCCLIVPLFLWGIIFVLVLPSLGQALQHPAIEQKSLIPKIDGNCFDRFHASSHLFLYGLLELQLFPQSDVGGVQGWQDLQ